MSANGNETLPMKSTTDIIVIGAGIIGCAIAYELAKAGRSVLVIEKEQIGCEASSAAAGMLSAQLSHATEHPTSSFFHLQIESRALFSKVVAELEKESSIAVDFKQNGIFYLLFSKKEMSAMQSRILWQERHSLPVEHLTPHQLRQREPMVDQPVFGAFYFPEDAQVDNTCLTLAYAKGAEKKGAQFLLGHRVKRILVEKGGVKGVQANSGRIYRAPVVINACGSGAGFDKNLPFRIPVFPAKGQILAFKFRELPFHSPVASSAGYAVPREKNSLLVGTTVEFKQYQKSVTQRGIKEILSSLSQFTSCLKNQTPYEQWAGLRPCTPDHLPILGKTPIQGLYIAGGHFRDGILLAPITAKLMTELILKGKTSISLKPFSLERFL